MPISRAPRRLTAVARSALPRSVRSKKSEQRHDQRDRGREDDQRLAGEDERADRKARVPEARVAKALGAEEEQAQPGQREMHADRDDQQHQHRRVGERLRRRGGRQRAERR